MDGQKKSRIALFRFWPETRTGEKATPLPASVFCWQEESGDFFGLQLKTGAIILYPKMADHFISCTVDEVVRFINDAQCGTGTDYENSIFAEIVADPSEFESISISIVELRKRTGQDSSSSNSSASDLIERQEGSGSSRSGIDKNRSFMAKPINPILLEKVVHVPISLTKTPGLQKRKRNPIASKPKKSPESRKPMRNAVISHVPADGVGSILDIAIATIQKETRKRRSKNRKTVPKVSDGVKATLVFLKKLRQGDMKAVSETLAYLGTLFPKVP